MKEASLRIPDEGELWFNDNDANWYMVRKGRFHRVAMGWITSATDPAGLELGLVGFLMEGRLATCDVFAGHNGWTLRAENAMEEVEQIALEKLDAWQKELEAASCALVRFMAS